MRRLFICLLLLLAAWTGPAAERTSHETTRSSDTEAAPTTPTVSQESKERETLLQREAELEARLRRLEFQRDKYASAIEAQRLAQARLDARKDDIRELALKLEPFLADTVERLTTIVDADPPFLREERTRRVAFLRESLADPRLEPAEKLRRVLEALRVEAGYGLSVETTDETLLLDGVETQVTVLRLGRLALFFVTPDGGRMGRYDRAAGQWIDLDEASRRALRHALDIAERRRPAELLRLPVDAGAGATP